MKRRFQILALVLGISLLGCSCANISANEDDSQDTQIDNSNSEEISKQNKLDLLRPTAYGTVTGLNLDPGSYISIIARASDNSYWEEVEAGAQQAIDELNELLGYTGDDKIRATLSAPGIVDDIDEQVSILDEELARYPIAVCIAPVDTSACLTQFELAEQDRIQIITFDSGSEYQHVGAHISTNNLAASATAAKELAALMNNTGEVALIVHDSDSMTAKEREEGFMNEIAKYPEISVPVIYHLDELEDLAIQIADEKNAGVEDESELINPEDFNQEDIILYLLESNPNLKAIYTTNLDTSQLLAEVLKDVEDTDYLFVGFDGGEEQIELLTDEVVDGLIIQNPYGMGYATVVAAARTVLNLPNEAFVDSGYTWVTKDNMELPSVQKYLY